MGDEERLRGEGFASFQVERESGAVENWHAAVEFRSGTLHPGVMVGPPSGAVRDVPASDPGARRYLARVAHALLVESRRRELVRPNWKPTPRRSKPGQERLVPCPECAGRDPHCETCYGTSSVPERVAQEWERRHTADEA